MENCVARVILRQQSKLHAENLSGTSEAKDEALCTRFKKARNIKYIAYTVFLPYSHRQYERLDNR